MAVLNQDTIWKQAGRSEWWILAVLALVAYGCAWAGFYQYTTHSAWYGLFDFRRPGLSERASAAYYALEMMIMKAPYLNGDVPAILHIGRWLSALVFFWATCKVLFAILHRDIQSFRSRFRKKHTIVCGLGQLGLRLALQAKRRGEKPVVVENDPASQNIHTAIRHHIPVVIGDATDPKTLLRARMDRANQVFAVCEDDGINLGIAHLLTRSVTRASATDRLECWLFIGDATVRAALRQHDLLAPQDSSCRVNVRGLDIGSVCARKAFGDLPLDHVSLPVASGKRPRLIVVGFGEMGRNLVLQAGRIAHFPSAGKLHITLVDTDVERRLDAFRGCYPNLGMVADIEPVMGAAEEEKVRERLMNAYRAAGEAGELLTCAFCHDDDNGRNMALALDLASTVPGAKVPILVHLTTRYGFAQLMTGDGSHSVDPRLRPFGMIEDVMKLETLQDEKQDRVAMAFHEAYLASRVSANSGAGETAGRPAEKPWEVLDETYREANRALADHLPVKLHGLGLRMCPTAECREQPVSELSPSDIELLARMEHARWCAERWLSGWTHATETDKARKLHADLVSWELLPESERRIDTDLMSNIVEALRRIDHVVVPASSPRETGTSDS